jgi:hypothetical protein
MIIVELSGGLGNQMFQYALGKHLALKNNSNLVLDKTFLQNRSPRKNFIYRNFDLDIFDIDFKFTESKISNEFGMMRSKLKKIKSKLLPFNKINHVIERDFDFNPDIFLTKSPAYLNGYWQNVKYFEPISDLIRKDFKLDVTLDLGSKVLEDKIFSENSVCVNVRRADFVTNDNHGTLPIEYYLNAEQILQEKHNDELSYFVFSDDIEWCQKNLKFNSKTIFVTHDFAGEKFKNYLYLMIKCKNFIIPNSSFAWWAAWLSESQRKIVITPKIWLHNISYETSNMCPKDWISI